MFAQVLLADEINRASPKTQSALLEAMEEKQVTVEGETRALPSPFFVIATQNPHDQLGTFALPESQLDRFLMRISLGYPDRAAERELLNGADRRGMVESLRSTLTPDRPASAAAEGAAGPRGRAAAELRAGPGRRHAARAAGSCRACRRAPGIAVVRAAKAQALLSGPRLRGAGRRAGHPAADGGASPDPGRRCRPRPGRAGARHDGGRAACPEAPWMPRALQPLRAAPGRPLSPAGGRRACRCPTRSTLTQRNVYILPTRPGFMLGATLRGAAGRLHQLPAQPGLPADFPAGRQRRGGHARVPRHAARPDA